MIDVQMIVREALKHAKSKGMTQKEVLEIAGHSRVALHYWRAGKHAPSIKHLELLLNACGLQLDYKLIPIKKEIENEQI